MLHYTAMDTLRRGSLASLLGVGIETIRYYEKRGLIPEARRDSNGYRIYSEEDAETIRHLLIARTFGFSLREIKEATDTIRPGSPEFVSLIESKVREIEQKMSELRSIRKKLLELLPQKRRPKA